jgi:dTDP-glucose 4,6-dehydratase
MRLVVTGAAGFMGSDFVRMLVRRGGYEISVLDSLTYAGNLRNLSEVWEDPTFGFVQGDICDADLVRSLLQRADGIVHFAAESGVDRSILNDEAFVRTNVEGTRVLLSMALEAKITRFVMISTDEVYGELPWRDPAQEPTRSALERFRRGEPGASPFFTETTCFAPRSPYAASKAAADHLSMAYHRTHGLPVVVTRSSNAYGPGQHPEKLIPRSIAFALAEEPIPIYGDGKHVRDWLHVRDHSLGVLAALGQGVPGRAYNLGGMSERTNLQIVRSILTQLDRSTDQIEFVGDRSGHDRRYGVDPLRASRELGWEPVTKLDTGLSDTVAWHLENPDWWAS